MVSFNNYHADSAKNSLEMEAYVPQYPQDAKYQHKYASVHRNQTECEQKNSVTMHSLFHRSYPTQTYQRQNRYQHTYLEAEHR